MRVLKYLEEACNILCYQVLSGVGCVGMGRVLFATFRTRFISATRSLCASAERQNLATGLDRSQL